MHKGADAGSGLMENGFFDVSLMDGCQGPWGHLQLCFLGHGSVSVLGVRVCYSGA